MLQLFALIRKEWLLEWRQRYALQGLLLYVVSTSFVVYMGVEQGREPLSAPLWNALWWIIVLFTAINATAKSFLQESEEQYNYYYSLVSPYTILLSKVIYNIGIMVLLGVAGFLAYIMFLPVDAINPIGLGVCLLIGCASFACSLTMVAAIAAKASQSSVLMAILSFPILIPQLLILNKASLIALSNTDNQMLWQEVKNLLLIDVVVLAVAFVLFPYLWRS